MTSHRPWSPHPPAHYQEPSTDPRGVENYLQAQANAPSYYDPYAAQGGVPSWQPPAQPRQPTLPMTGHQQQATDASIEALNLAEYSSRLNAQQAQMYSQPPAYHHPAPYPQSAYPYNFSLAQYDHEYRQAQQSVPPPTRDFIDSGPFSYSGVRETTPPIRISPPPQAQVRPVRTESPLPPRGHLPWATEHDVGEPDPVFPPSPDSPRRSDSSTTFPLNVQQPDSNAHTSETLHTPENRDPQSYFSPDPEANEHKKDWGVREGDRPGDIGPDGKLISNGPRLRIAVRVLEAVAAAGAITACIYAFAVPKPNPAAPPASKPAVYVIVVLGFFTLLSMGYIYVLRGCCGIGRKNDARSHAMALPISRHRAGRKDRKHDSVQVNLIVDSSVFGKRDLTPGVPWTEQQATNSSGVFTSFERERARLSARKGLWWALGFDVLGAVVWGVAFVLAMVGPRCPAGGYSGWCDAYNGSVACACIGCALFVTSAVLVGRDLMVSRRSERKLR